MNTTSINISQHSTPIYFALQHLQNRLTRDPAHILNSLPDLPDISEAVEKERLSANNTILALEDRIIHAEHDSHTDALTGAKNRRAYDEEGPKLLGTTRRLNGHLTLIGVDLDHFKEMNDTYGHDAGDYVLQAFTRAAKESLREEDSVYRKGGDEFSIILVSNEHASPGTAYQKINEINERFSRYIQEFSKDPTQQVTVSASYGFACYDRDVRNVFNYTAQDAKDLFRTLEKIADQRLYQAKENGKHQGSIVGYDAA